MTTTNGTVLFDATAPRTTATAPALRHGVDVSPEGAARAKADEDAARAAGFALPPPIYTLGTLVNETGIENFRRSRQEYDALPSAEGALADLAERIRKECRQDRLVKVRELRMGPDGTLARDPKNALPMTRRAFGSLCSFVLPGAASAYLSECPADLRALNVNHWLAAEDAERELLVRTRRPGGAGSPGEIFAIVGPRYSAFDLDRVARAVAKEIPQGARAEVTYDGTRARIYVLWHTTVAPEGAVAGEIFRVGVLISAADDGTGSIKVESIVERNLCLNLIIIATDRQATMRRRHVGQGIELDVRRGVEQALKHVDHFRRQWTGARALNVCEQYDVPSAPGGVRDIYGALIDAELIQAPGGHTAVVDRLMTGWYAEGGYSAADVVNGITRAAHEATWSSPWVADDLQRQAGALLARPDWARVAPILTE